MAAAVRCAARGCFGPRTAGLAPSAIDELTSARQLAIIAIVFAGGSGSAAFAVAFGAGVGATGIHRPRSDTTLRFERSQQRFHSDRSTADQ